MATRFDVVSHYWPNFTTFAFVGLTGCIETGTVCGLHCNYSNLTMAVLNKKSFKVKVSKTTI